LILYSARELEAQGKLDEAFERYVAVLHMARHVAERGTTREWSDGLLLETKVGKWIGGWAAHPDQTAERIETAAKRIGQEAGVFPPLQGAVATEQFMLRRVVEDDWAELLPKLQIPEQEAAARTTLKVLDRLCPWEHARNLRVLDLIGASELHCLAVLDNGLATPGLDMQLLARLAGAVPATEDPTYLAINQQYRSFPGHRLGAGDFFTPESAGTTPAERVPWNWLKTTYPLNQSFRETTHERLWQLRLRRELSLRSMLLRLKLAAYKKTRGEYPEQLGGHDLGMNAIDPYTGAEFGYRREGFASAIPVKSGLTYAEVTLAAGQPILWSAGPSNVRHFAPVPETNMLTMQASGGGAPQPVHARHRFANTTALVFPLP
jgi:hypothetical protein